jgi:hypothetical protein
MQMQATRIDLRLAPSGLSKKRKNVALWILDGGREGEAMMWFEA